MVIIPQQQGNWFILFDTFWGWADAVLLFGRTELKYGIYTAMYYYMLLKHILVYVALCIHTEKPKSTTSLWKDVDVRKMCRRNGWWEYVGKKMTFWWNDSGLCDNKFCEVDIRTTGGWASQLSNEGVCWDWRCVDDEAIFFLLHRNVSVF